MMIDSKSPIFEKIMRSSVRLKKVRNIMECRFLVKTLLMVYPTGMNHHYLDLLLQLKMSSATYTQNNKLNVKDSMMLWWTCWLKIPKNLLPRLRYFMSTRLQWIRRNKWRKITSNWTSSKMSNRRSRLNYRNNDISHYHSMHQCLSTFLAMYLLNCYQLISCLPKPETLLITSWS